MAVRPHPSNRAPPYDGELIEAPQVIISCKSGALLRSTPSHPHPCRVWFCPPGRVGAQPPGPTPPPVRKPGPLLAQRTMIMAGRYYELLCIRPSVGRCTDAAVIAAQYTRHPVLVPPPLGEVRCRCAGDDPMVAPAACGSGGGQYHDVIPKLIGLALAREPMLANPCCPTTMPGPCPA